MSKSTDFTIVTPSLNQGEFLTQTLESIWNQKGNFTLEHIVADGGSTDNSNIIVARFSKLLDSGKFKPRCRKLLFRHWSQADNGQSSALKAAFLTASGSYLAWLNSDDLYADDGVLDHVARIMRSKKPDILLGNAQAIDRRNKPLDLSYTVNRLNTGWLTKSEKERFFHLPFFSQPATFFSRRALKMLELDENLHFTMDWDLLVQAAKLNLKFYKTDKTLALERLHSEAKTTKNQKAMYKEMAKLMRKHQLWNLEHLAVIKKFIIA